MMDVVYPQKKIRMYEISVMKKKKKKNQPEMA